MRHFLVLLPVLALAACVEPETPAQPGPEDACGAAKYQGLAGQPSAVLDNMTFPAGTRIIQPNSAVTMDFRPDRLNIEISKNGRIDKLSCY